MPGAKALAYLASSSAMKEKSFITLTPSVHFIKLFSLLQITRPNKLEGLSLETLSSQVLEFEGKARAAPLEHLPDASFLGKLLVFPKSVRLDCKVIASTNTRWHHRQ